MSGSALGALLAAFLFTLGVARTATRRVHRDHRLVGIAAVRVLEAAGYSVRIPERRLCCGLTWISTGQLATARKVLHRSVTALADPARAGDLRPVLADDLLAERALLGDAPARSALVSRVHRTLQQSPHLWETAAAYLEGGQGVEGTARALFVHANTVRYRLGAITRETGLDLADPHDALTARLSLLWGRLDDARKSPGQAVGRP